MKLINRKRSLKLAGVLLALLVSLSAVEAAMKFMAEYRYVGFEKKTGSWRSIAASAQGELSACQSALDQTRLDKQSAVEALNPDLFN